MTVRIKLQLVVITDDEEVCVDDIVVLDKQHERLEHLGLSLAEAKPSCRSCSVKYSRGRLRRSWPPA